jgi:hypothetical protein
MNDAMRLVDCRPHCPIRPHSVPGRLSELKADTASESGFYVTPAFSTSDIS